MDGEKIEYYTEQYRHARINWLRAAGPLLESKRLLIDAYMRYHYPGTRYNMVLEVNTVQFDFPALSKQEAARITEEIERYFDQVDQLVEDYFTRLLGSDE